MIMERFLELMKLFLSIFLIPFYAFSYVIGGLISVIQLGYYEGRYDYNFNLGKKKGKVK